MKRAAALISCLVLATPVWARPVTPAEEREQSYSASLPGCDDPFVLQSVASRFSTKEGRFWGSDLTIVSFEGIRQTAWRPWGLDYIPRRFCSGVANVSDGHKRRVDYSIRDGLGFLGFGWGTEACVEGLDRNYGFAPDCKEAQP